jgi:hypothetical protein
MIALLMVLMAALLALGPVLRACEDIACTC